jgi:capsular exopolysaccharide synthesis family protein
MRETPNMLDFKEDDHPIAFMDVLLKYLRYWPWFLISGALFLVLGYCYEKYAPKTYSSVAKVKILDDTKQTKIIPNEVAMANQNMRLNLENHVEVLKSYRLLNDVVRELKLDIEYYELGRLFFTKTYGAPFEVSKKIDEKALAKPLEYEVILSTSGFNITDKEGKKYILPYDKTNSSEGDELPFRLNLVEIANIKDYKYNRYKIIIRQEKQASLLLAKELKISTSEKQSDILTLSLKGQSRELSEATLNSIVKNFDQDGVTDRQLVAKRTLEVIDKRFIYLTRELDSIEAGKENFKKNENLSYIQADADVSLRRKSAANSSVAQLQTQISLSKLLKRTVSEEIEYNLLPGNIGLDNQGLNDLVTRYNEMARERQKLIVTVGTNHPRLKALSEQLELGKLNILNSVNVYESQLDVSLQRLNRESENAGSSFAKLPEKERTLRAIERQQSIKENLYLLLLRKREEAAIEFAATIPTVKVVDYGLTPIKPMWPKKTIVYPLSLLLGMFMPFMVVFIRSALDTKIHDRSDIEKISPEIPVLIEIPFFAKEKSFANVNDRSALAESFRILSTNTDYLLSSKNLSDGKVIFMTSSIKAEGKTLLAMNLSMAYASMGKKVLLMGADLRNPQLHTYFDYDKNVTGLADYLINPNMVLTDVLRDGFSNNPNHKLCLSGGVPKNVPVLLSSKRFGEFIEKAKKEFDYVVVDTAPTMLVTDTLLISKYADITLFTVCSGYTDKKLLQFSKDLNRTKKLSNMAYVLNAVGHTKGAEYNYGYNYGYDSNTDAQPWYKKKVKKNKPLKKSA